MARERPIIVKLPAFFPPVMGFRDDYYYGLRTGTRNACYWVDADVGVDDNIGTNPDFPKLTIQDAITDLRAVDDGAQIFCRGDFTETVIVPPTAPQNCQIIGLGDGLDLPTWQATAANGVALTIRQSGWKVEGFRFTPGALGTSIRLEWIPGSSFVANRTMIANNHFDGLWQGLYGIQLWGAPFDVWIINNEFREYRNGAAGAFAIVVMDSATANPFMNVIRNNLFWENENHIGSVADDRSFNLSVFKHNTFHDGVLIAATRILDLRGGSRGENIVTENTFSGDYSNAGGYWANAANPGNWVGNFCEDVAELEVADNGVSVLPPAA